MRPLEKSNEEIIFNSENNSKIVGYAFCFSLLLAFHIGWHDLNVGSKVMRFQTNAYTLRAEGIVRSVSGLQSIVSVYLLALWALTYFGTPAE